MKTILAFVLVALVAACASTVAKTPAQRVFALETEYAGLLQVAVTYESLPRCGTEKVRVMGGTCSSPSVVAVIRKADIDAYAVLKAAQDTVRSPFASDSTINLALTSAVNGISAMRSVLVNHGVLK